MDEQMSDEQEQPELKSEHFWPLIESIRKNELGTDHGLACGTPNWAVWALLDDIKTLKSALAERGEWQPIGDGTIDMDGDTIDILIINGDTWHMTVTEADYSQAMLIMPPDIRLCRRRPQSVVVDAPEPNWSHAPSWARFWTRDDKGPTWWWETKPYYDGKMGIWICDDEGRRAIATDIPTLRQRPQPAPASAVEATKG